MFDELVGRTLVSILRNSDGTEVTFGTTTGYLRYEAYADCCSESWVESINDITTGVTGSTVLKVSNDWHEEEDNRQGWARIDFVTIYTNKGLIQIEFRNSSNGYYGGNMSLVEEGPAPIPEEPTYIAPLPYM